MDHGLFRVRDDIVDQLADGLDLLRQLDLDADLVLKVHQHLDGVERVDADILETGVTGDFGGIGVVALRDPALRWPEKLYPT